MGEKDVPFFIIIKKSKQIPFKILAFSLSFMIEY